MALTTRWVLHREPKRCQSQKFKNGHPPAWLCLNPLTLLIKILAGYRLLAGPALITQETPDRSGAGENRNYIGWPKELTVGALWVPRYSQRARCNASAG